MATAPFVQPADPSVDYVSVLQDIGDGRLASTGQPTSSHRAVSLGSEPFRSSSATDESLANLDSEFQSPHICSRVGTVDSELPNQFELADKRWASYEERIRALTEESYTEGYFFHPVSLDAFWRFIGWFVSQYPDLVRGRIGLMENGNLRVIWKGDQGTHLGLQFLPDERIQYVIFIRFPGSDTISRLRGRDAVDGIRWRIEAFDLHNRLTRDRV